MRFSERSPKGSERASEGSVSPTKRHCPIAEGDTRPSTKLRKVDDWMDEAIARTIGAQAAAMFSDEELAWLFEREL